MQYGICNLSIVPVRIQADDASEMLSQLLYGEHFKVLEKRKRWSRIRISFDGTEGWITNGQFTFLEEVDFNTLEAAENPRFSSDLVSYTSTENSSLMPIVLGSSVGDTALILNQLFEGSAKSGIQEKMTLVDTALLYLNAPYLKGGRTPFGIDCSGLVQMAYKINGHKLSRTASSQAVQGEALSFIEESEAGDLAFFDNPEGVIDHVGLIMNDNFIIHVNGKVRIDRLDHTGIFNTDINNYSHKLRVIKKIIQ